MNVVFGFELDFVWCLSRMACGLFISLFVLFAGLML